MLVKHFEKQQLLKQDRVQKSGNPFCGKRVLDIGCHIGTVSLEIAQRYEPAYVVGCDIDGKLIQAAIKNIQRSVNTTHQMNDLEVYAEQ